jgi:hypothetical protein
MGAVVASRGRSISSRHEATDYLADTRIARRLLDTMDPQRRVAALEAVTDLLRDHDDSGIRLGAGINLITARA